MKKICLFAMIISILFTFFSCSAKPLLPKYSETFDKDFVDSFFEEYTLRDLQLRYFSAAPYEVEIKQNLKNGKIFYWRLAELQNVDKKDYLAVTLGIDDAVLFMGYTRCDYFCVYQNVESQNPIEEWTIKSVSLVKGYTPPQENFIYLQACF